MGKIVLLLEWRAQRDPASPPDPPDKLDTPDQTENIHSHMFSMVKDVLHNVFLKNYPKAEGTVLRYFWL